MERTVIEALCPRRASAVSSPRGSRGLFGSVLLESGHDYLGRPQSFAISFETEL